MDRREALKLIPFGLAFPAAASAAPNKELQSSDAGVLELKPSKVYLILVNQYSVAADHIRDTADQLGALGVSGVFMFVNSIDNDIAVMELDAAVNA